MTIFGKKTYNFEVDLATASVNLGILSRLRPEQSMCVYCSCCLQEHSFWQLGSLIWTDWPNRAPSAVIGWFLSAIFEVHYCVRTIRMLQNATAHELWFTIHFLSSFIEENDLESKTVWLGFCLSEFTLLQFWLSRTAEQIKVIDSEKTKISFPNSNRTYFEVLTRNDYPYVIEYWKWPEHR